MAVDPTCYYGDLADAVAYFTDERLNEQDFLGKSSDNQEKAPLAATRAIDALKFSGVRRLYMTCLKLIPMRPKQKSKLRMMLKSCSSREMIKMMYHKTSSLRLGKKLTSC